MNKIRQVLTLLRWIKDIIPALWFWASRGAAIHWHIQGFYTKEEYRIIFDELHKAHVNYLRRLKVQYKAQTRRRDKKGRFV